ncbi:MAG: hypothetical protein ACYDGR_11360 [Candidatus Dormibacteria bacterium]
MKEVEKRRSSGMAALDDASQRANCKVEVRRPIAVKTIEDEVRGEMTIGGLHDVLARIPNTT